MKLFLRSPARKIQLKRIAKWLERKIIKSPRKKVQHSTDLSVERSNSKLQLKQTKTVRGQNQKVNWLKFLPCHFNLHETESLTIWLVLLQSEESYKIFHQIPI